MGSSRRFLFRIRTLKSRSRKGKPVWLWKWTKDAWYKHRQYKRSKPNDIYT